MLILMSLSLFINYGIAQVDLGNYISRKGLQNLPTIKVIDDQTLNIIVPSEVSNCNTNSGLVTATYEIVGNKLRLSYEKVQYMIDTLDCEINPSYVRFTPFLLSSEPIHKVATVNGDTLQFDFDKDLYGFKYLSSSTEDFSFVAIRYFFELQNGYTWDFSLDLSPKYCYEIRIVDKSLCNFDYHRYRHMTVLSKRKIKIGKNIYKLARVTD